jgi:hypothetical protein
MLVKSNVKRSACTLLVAASSSPSVNPLFLLHQKAAPVRRCGFLFECLLGEKPMSPVALLDWLGGNSRPARYTILN